MGMADGDGLGFVADGHKRFFLFGLRPKMGSFGIFRFCGPEAETIEIAAAPAWTVPGEDRCFTVNIGMIRLVDRES